MVLGHGGYHPAFFVTSVVLPLCFVAIMNGIEGLTDQLASWRHRTIKIAWDNCVLAIGIVAGVLANDQVTKAYGGTEFPVILATIGVIISLGTAIGIAYVRKSIHKPNDPAAHVAGWKVLLCLCLSGASLAFPGIVAFTY